MQTLLCTALLKATEQVLTYCSRNGVAYLHSSRASATDAAKSEAMEGQNELLSLLLEQREAQGGDASLELPSPKDSQEVESCEEEEEEVGGIWRWQHAQEPQLLFEL